MIEVQGLFKKYGSYNAVENLSFFVEGGTIFGILGPNGSGKTTTVRILCGLLNPDSGSIRIMGLDVVKDPVKVKALLGVLPDGSALFPYLTLWEHLVMEARIRGLDAGTAHTRAEDLLRYVDLWEKRRIRVCDCSVGMRKKLGIILALIHKPPVVILDEPFEGLDPVSARKIHNLLQTMVANCGTTMIITSHMLALIEDLVDRVAIVSGGRILREITDPQQADKRLLDTYLEVFDHVDGNQAGIQWLS